MFTNRELSAAYKKLFRTKLNRVDNAYDFKRNGSLISVPGHLELVTLSQAAGCRPFLPIMASQDGISVRQMRLKILYTFDSESKETCLARWPHLLDIQTAYLDDETQIGVIELKTCIQAIVSASPELVAKLGRDYTIYAYDYSEYETPLVGQGMLSWVLASASPTPDAPAHQSKTIVTGRVCKNVLGLFSKGAQETLEVKLRLVPVPTILQSEYLESMQKYRELSNVIPQEFDAQAWTSFIQSNPGILGGSPAPQPSEHAPSPMDLSGIEKFHQLLSESSTPRELPNNFTAPEVCRAGSPTASQVGPSRNSTPGLGGPASQQQKRSVVEAFRPVSRASSCTFDSQGQPGQYANPLSRRNSVMSDCRSVDETAEPPAPKRAKVVRAEWPNKANMNIERQPGSLRVAASTAASVRIHRPMPINPAAMNQGSPDDPVRPPTPVPRNNPALGRPIRPIQSNLRRQSSHFDPNALPSVGVDGRRLPELAATSPEDVRQGSVADTPYNIPSSPPVLENMHPQTSSPILPPFPDHDSGFMSGPIDSALDDEAFLGTNIDDMTAVAEHEGQVNLSEPQDRTHVQRSQHAIQHGGHDYRLQQSDLFAESASQLPPQPQVTGSRPSSRASAPQRPKPVAPAPMPQNAARDVVLASDPVHPQPHSFHRQSWNGPMSDLVTSASNPAPVNLEEERNRNGVGARRSKQVQARLDACIRQGTVPPYCQNCGAIETPTWRRAWSKVIDGDGGYAKSFSDDPLMLFWKPEDVESDGTMTSFKLYKKSLADEDKEFDQLLLCNPCGLWLHKFKNMRPENKWNKQPPKDKRKRKSRRTNGPLSEGGVYTRSRSKAQTIKPADSSPVPTDASSPATNSVPDNAKEVGKDSDIQHPPTPSRRANSAEPPRSTGKDESCWRNEEAREALRRAIQSSPARNMESNRPVLSETSLTPKPVRRSLFPPKGDEPMKTLSDSLVNAIRRSPRNASKQSKTTPSKENADPTTNDGLDDLFGSPRGEGLGAPFSSSPTPKRKNRRLIPQASLAASEQGENEQPSPSRLTTRELRHTNKGLSPRTNDSRTRHPETIDGILLDIFDSDGDSAAQTDTFRPFEPPKCPPSGTWTDWAPEEHAPSKEHQGQENGAETEGNRHHSTDDEIVDRFLNGHTFSNDFEDEARLRSLLDEADSFVGGSPKRDSMLQSDIFDPSLVDPELLNLPSTESHVTEFGNVDHGELDPSVLSAIFQNTDTRFTGTN